MNTYNTPNHTPALTPTEIAVDLGARIKHARLRRNISAARLAAQASISLPTLRQVEKGSLSVGFGTIVRILIGLKMGSDFEHLAADAKLARLCSSLMLPKRALAYSRRRRKSSF